MIENQQNPTESIDELTEFANWWWNHRIIMPPFSNNLLTFDNNVTGITLFRQAPFQVQLFIVKPNTEIVDHIHPNVDSYELYLGGQNEFRLPGIDLIKPDEIYRDENGLCNQFGNRWRVHPDDPHGGFFGPMGGAFLSIQLWKNGIPPDCVSRNWKFQEPEEIARNRSIQNVLPIKATEPPEPDAP